MTVREFQEKHGIIGKSKEIRDLIDIVLQVAQSDISVLIQGESGTGKEVFARAIHEASRRANNKLVSVNCGAIPEGILESELFGHEKGAFTGAIESRKGYFEIADNGTLFLDEIGEMPLTTQVKFLRVLETREFMRIGGEKTHKVNIRIVAATNKDLKDEVAAKKFRNDLYFRLKAVTLNIPPLRERKEDISALIYHFLDNYSLNNNIPQISITPAAMDILVNYSWPGNVREVKNTIETAVALTRTGVLDEASFQMLLSDDKINEDNRFLPVHLRKSPDALDREMIYRALIEIKKDLIELKSMAFNNQHDEPKQDYGIHEVVPLSVMEKDAIINALNFSRGNKRKAAKLLGIGERTLYRKLKEYEIQ
ncbi:MAG: sigma-54-dependent Fis family transcriptional regulator [Melioribacteraceae bacterium]|nr:MAG: sigma-54-dependent Fis family transcriptional regulator [Melioribacteraceae bacterium]